MIDLVQAQTSDLDRRGVLQLLNPFASLFNALTYHYS